MFKNRSFQVKLVKDATEAHTPEPQTHVIDLTQITSDDARRTFVYLFGAYASVKILNTACKVAIIAATK